jgi:hypothetical protein
MLGRQNSVNYYDQKSYLKNTPFKNFYLDTASLPSVRTSNGETVMVPPECENRIDLFSYKMYGSSRLWWIIALANADVIKDPIWDFRSGITVFVPRDTVLLEKLAGVK